MKKILITGGAGYLGSILTETLLKEGHSVTILDNLSYNQLSLSGFCSNENFNFVLGDVRNESLLEKLVNENEVIIPLAAIVGMPACKAQPELTVKVNFEQVRNITKWITKDQMLLVPNTNSPVPVSSDIEASICAELILPVCVPYNVPDVGSVTEVKAVVVIVVA